MENPHYVYIEPSQPDIRNYRELIKKQITCRYEISSEKISHDASTFTFGYLVYLERAHICRRSVKSLNDRFNSSSSILLSFILCNYTNAAPDQVFIELICSNNKTGKFLIELAEEKVRSMGIKRICLFLLDKDRLINWYKSLGYVFVNKNFDTKLSLMMKYI